MNYRPEIDGLRAVAVLPVILFHAGFGIFSGGYVGVDVFFVISGYLITSILIAELEEGDFSIARFYERRMRRILPALFVVMSACLPFAYLWMPPSQLTDFAKSLVAVVLFASNMLFWHESGYFSGAAELKPLLHTWSLAVEEQYYLLFPLFLRLLWRFGRARILLGIVALALISFALSEWGSRHSPTANFYLAPTRAWELLAGSICAFLTVGKAQRSNNMLGALGLALIAFSIFSYDSNTPFPSAYTLAPVIGTTLILLFAAQGTWVAKLLGLRALVGIGLISYSAYLWHQPLFAFARLRSLTEPSGAVMAALAALSVLLAWATWFWVEQTFRSRKNPVLPTQRSVFATSAMVSALFVVIGLAGYLDKGFQWRSPSDIHVSDLDTRTEANKGLHTDCEVKFNTSPNCYTSPSPDVLLWGDSFAMHLVQGIVASENGIALQQHTLSSCAPVLGLAQFGKGTTKDWAAGCISFNNSVIDWLRAHKSVKLVILSSPFDGVLGDDLLLEDGNVLSEDQQDLVKQSLMLTVGKIRETGARVVIVSPTPASGWDNGQCLIRSIYFAIDDQNCNFPLDMATAAFAMLKAVEDKVAVYWLHKDFCNREICDVLQDGIFIFRDRRHLSKEGSAFLGFQHDWMQAFRTMAN